MSGGVPAGVEAIRHYVAMRDAKPLRQSGDVIHSVHAGTEWEAELRLSDLRLAATPTPPIEGRDADVGRVREALTPSGATKAAYHGEFTFDLCVGISDAGIEQYQKVYVPWDTVKEIMAAIRARAALQALGERG